MKKRLLSLLLSAALVLLLLPLGALTAQAEMDRIGEVTAYVTAPAPGTASADVDPFDCVELPDGADYTIRGAEWQTKVVEDLFQAFTGTFEEGETYYLWLDYLANDGFVFNQGGDPGYTTVDAYGGTPLVDHLSVTNVYDGKYISSGTVMIACTVTAPTTFFGVLISDADGNVNQGGGYCLDYSGNEFGADVRTSATNNFVAEGALVTITAVPDEGYRFVGWYQGEPNGAPGTPVYSGDVISTNKNYIFTAPLFLELPYLCAVFEEGEDTPGRKAYQVSVWAGYIDGNRPLNEAGGKVAVRYTPTEPNVYDIPAQDGTGFGYLALAGCYVGDEITVLAKADEGYHFVGWYRVNIEFDEGGSDTDMAGVSPNKAYQGEVISTASAYTYKPCVTVLPGDAEPLRYICAVFAPGEGSLKGDANGDGSVDMKDVLVMRKYIANLTDEIDLAAADVNGDGSVDMKDVLFVRKYIAKLIESF